MIYADYARRKMHNVVKLGTAEGYPLVINNAEGKKLKDYTIEGNTEYGENLFDSPKADGNGWINITYDNTGGSTSAYRFADDRINYNLKPDTVYYLYTQIAAFNVEGENIGSENYYLYSKSERSSEAVNSQFITPGYVRYTDVGIYKTAVKSRSDFTGCTNMLRSMLTIPAGLKITVKYRTMLTETEKDVFLPYTKTSVGDMTNNLFNYTEPLTTSAKADENGWFDISIDNTAESVANDIYCSTKVNTKLKPNTEYTILCEVLERSGNGKLFAVSSYTTTTTGGQFTASWDVLQNNGVALVSRKTRESFENCNSMLRTLCRAEAGQLFHIKFRIAVYECLPTEYQEVEYIESTGKEYIETGCLLNETSVVEIEASLKKSVPKAAGALFGSRINIQYSTGQQNALWWHNEEDENTAKLVGLVGESVYRTTDDTVQFGMFRKIRFGCDSLSIDGIKKFTFSKALYSNGINAVLFGLKTKNYCDTKRFNGKIKYCRITTDDVLVRNFIPCYRKSDNIAGMYDTVNGVFYTNASTTGSFLKGADKTYSFEPYNKYKIPIIVNDETATTAYLDAPLASGKSANYKLNNLPDIMLADGTNTITVGTDVKPKKISAKYYKK